MIFSAMKENSQQRSSMSFHNVDPQVLLIGLLLEHHQSSIKLQSLSAENNFKLSRLKIDQFSVFSFTDVVAATGVLPVPLVPVVELLYCKSLM